MTISFVGEVLAVKPFRCHGLSADLQRIFILAVANEAVMNILRDVVLFLKTQAQGVSSRDDDEWT